MMGMSIGVFFLIFGRSTDLCLIMIDETPQTFIWKFFTICIVFIGLYCVISSYAINQRWRKIVEEDTAKPVDIEALERSSLSLRSLQKFLYYSLAMPVVALLLAIPATMIVIELCTSLRWWAYFEYIHFLSQTDFAGTCAFFVFLSFVIIFTLFTFVRVVGMRISDEKSLTVWQPRIPNYLQVLTGEEKPKRGLRYRTNFWNDLLLVGVGLCMIQGGVAIIGSGITFEPPKNFIPNWRIAIYVISFVAYLLFAMFFAGIPRKRYFGYFYLGVFIAILNVVYVLSVEMWYRSLLVSTAPLWQAMGYSFTFGGILFWLSCFILSGVLGLYAFRKKDR